MRAAVSDSAAAIGLVESGEVSVGLVGRKADNPHLAFRHLADDRMVVVTPPGCALGRKGRVTLDELATRPLVVREVGSGIRHCFEKALERAGHSLADLRVVLELGSNEAIKEAVLRGVGVAVLSALGVRKDLDAGRLRASEVDGFGCDREMFVVTDRRRVAADGPAVRGTPRSRPGPRPRVISPAYRPSPDYHRRSSTLPSVRA